MDLSSLPADIIEVISRYLDNDAIVNLTRTCIALRYNIATIPIGIKTFTITLSEKQINRYPWLVAPPNIASNCDFVIICRKPYKCVEKLLSLTNGDAGSISLKIYGDFDIHRLGLAHRIDKIEWDVNIKRISYRHYLTYICSPPNLKELTINVTGIAEREGYLVNIDRIKETINTKKIHLTIGFQLSMFDFSHITNDIDYITIMLDSSVVGRGEYSQQILLKHNKLLTIDGITIYNHRHITVDFEDIHQVKFTRVCAQTNYIIVNRPIWLIVPRIGTIAGQYDGNDMVILYVPVA
jgi:hypothetical protein